MKGSTLGRFAAFVFLAAAPLSARAAPPVDPLMTCTNPKSGASWDIKIDYEKGTVDSNPAQIGDKEITWRDAKDRGNYSLDRATGKLTIIYASSTGGYFMYDQCQAKN